MALFLHLFNKVSTFCVHLQKKLYLRALKAVGRFVAGILSGMKEESPGSIGHPTC